MSKTNIIHTAIGNFERNTGFKVQWKDHEKLKNKELDGKIELTIGKDKLTFLIEAKKEIRFPQLPALFYLKEKVNNLMLIAETIFPKIKEELRNKDIAYLDGAGNIYFKTDHHYLWVDLNKKQTNTQKNIKTRAFTKTGLKVIFDFLLDEALLNTTYRKIADRNEVALGTIKYIFEGLYQLGYLIKIDKKTLKLTNKKELLERWITEYETKLKPALFIGNYRFLKDVDFANWKRIHFKNKTTQWGGEPAADILTNYLRPEILTIYTAEQRIEIIKNYRLIPDFNGNVKVYKNFWKYDEVNNNIVPTVLIYADLINTGNARNLETAKMIYNELLEDRY
ncbi:MAG: type IV toxin-antitoxin system AbiEi family antitoxin [Bacteroidota bacterium]